MAIEFVEITAGTGTKVAVDTIDTDKQAQIVKIAHGADGALDGLVDDASPLPVVNIGGLHTGANTIGAVSISAGLPTGANTIGAVSIVTGVTPGVGATNLGKAEDGGHTSGDVGVMALAVRTATPANKSDSDGDYEPLQMSAGALWVSPLGFPFRCSTDITRENNTTAYSADQTWADDNGPTSGGFTFTNAARKSGGSGIITDAIFTTSNDPATKLQAELWIFNTSVTAIADAVAFAVSDSEIKTLEGVIPFTMGDAGNNGYYHAQNLGIAFTCSGSANLRFLVRVKNSYTPASNEVLTCIIKGVQTD